MTETPAIDNTKITDDDIFEMLQYQGIVTTEQAQEYFEHKYHRNTIPGRLNRLCKANYLWKSSQKRPWAESPSGKPNNLYRINEDGAKEILRVSGVKLKEIKGTKDKYILHSLGLVEIAFKCKKMGYSCVVNRQVNIPDQSDDANPTYLQPDIQIYTANPDEPIKFIEYEQNRMTRGLYKILYARMKRWQLLFSSPEYERFSNDILVLFWFEEKLQYEQDKKDKKESQKIKLVPIITAEQKRNYALSLDIWMQALYDFEKELSLKGEKPNFRVHYKRFIDFLLSPTVDPEDYTLLLPSDNPQVTRLHQEREKASQKTANEILRPLDEEHSTDLLHDCEKQNKELWIKLLKASNRQEFFFSQIKMLYQLSNAYSYSGYAAAALPHPAISLVRHWIEQDQLLDLRESLIPALITTHAAAAKGQQTGAMMLEKTVWEVLFRYFNFASGGPLTFRVTLLSPESMDRPNDLSPDTRIETPWTGVIEDYEEAREMEKAINWFISTLMRYQKELGLTKDNRIVNIRNTKNPRG